MSILDNLKPAQQLARRFASHLILQLGTAEWPHSSTIPFESEYIPVRELTAALGAHPRLVLTGAAGSGKSTALIAIALAHARALAANHALSLVPIYFSARDLTSKRLPSPSELPAALSLDNFPPSFFKDAFAANRVLVLIDDLDTLPPDATKNLLLEFPASHVVATGQSVVPGMEEFPLPAWRDQDIERFAELKFAKRGTAFLGALKASGVPRLLTSNPMSLALLARAWESAAVLTPLDEGSTEDHDLHAALGIKQLPARRTQLFAAFANDVLRGDDEAARMLEGVALAIQRGKPATREFAGKSKGFLRESKNQTCDFVHLLWRAYFAARAVRLAGDISPIAAHLHDLDWRETIFFYAGLGEASELVAALIKDGDWHFAGEAIAHAQNVRADLRDEVTKVLVERAWKGDPLAPVVLGEMGSDAAVAALAARLKDPDPIVRSRAAEILGRMQLDRALEYLLPQMRDVNADTRDRVVQALGHSLSNRVIEPLLGAFRGDPRVGFVDTRLRVAAAQALGQVGSDKAVPALIVDLQTGEPEVRAVAVDALKRIHSPLMIKPLQGILPILDEATQKAVAVVLAGMNGGVD